MILCPCKVTKGAPVKVCHFTYSMRLLSVWFLIIAFCCNTKTGTETLKEKWRLLYRALSLSLSHVYIFLCKSSWPPLETHCISISSGFSAPNWKVFHLIPAWFSLFYCWKLMLPRYHFCYEKCTLTYQKRTSHIKGNSIRDFS